MKTPILWLILICLFAPISYINAQTYPLGNDTVLCGGQSITLNPFANAVIFEDSLVVTYNAVLGQTQLAGANKVYMHAGYQEAAFGPIAGWVGNWGQDDGIGEMRNLGNNFWRITIHVRNYFGINASTNINAIAMVFRNADGSATGKDDAGQDIYLVLGNPPTSAFSGVAGFIKRDNIATILWSTAASTPSITVSNSGNYSFVVTDTNGVSFSDDIAITYASAQLNLGNDVSLCGSASITLNAGAGFTNYLWSTGANTQTISVNTAGTYFVSAQIGACSATDTIIVTNNIPNITPVSLGNDTLLCGNMLFNINSGISIAPFGDSLTIIYNATLGQTQLNGANKVYFHSGYQLVPFGPIIGWVGNWGQDDGLGEMTNIGANLWSITINVNSYYSLAANVDINAIAMVFRSADGAQTGKDNAGQDIYLTVETNPTSAFSGVTGTYAQSPYTSILWSTGDTLSSISVNTTGIYSIEVNTSFGCILRDTIEVSLGNLPFVDAGSSQQICNGTSLLLDAGSGFASYEWSTGDTTSSITVNSSGTYIINVTNDLGCTGADVINIAILPAPVANYTYVVNAGGIVNYTNNSSDATTYAWDLNGDGTTDNTNLNTFYTYLNPGVYNVTLIVTNACGADTITFAVNTITGIENLNNTSEIVIYPNPANEIVTLSNINFVKNNVSVSVYDAIGNLVVNNTYKLTQNKCDINVNELSTGIYFIHVATDKTNKTIKFNKN